MKILLFFCSLAAVLALSAVDFPVKPYQRYRADFEIRAKAKIYPLDWFCINVPVKYPNAELVFLTDKNKLVRHFRVTRYHVFTDKFTAGSFEFYTPEGASKIRMRSSGAELRNFRRYAFQIEMKYTAHRLGFKIKEVPVVFVNRELGTSKMSGGIFSEAFFGVIRLRFKKYKKNEKKEA